MKVSNVFTYRVDYDELQHKMGPSLSQRNRSRKRTPGESCSTKTDHKMFVLTEMKDTVRIKPWHFGVDLREAIATKLNKKLANKVSGGTTIRPMSSSDLPTPTSCVLLSGCP